MLISIVYDSGYGHTAKQAEVVADGVNAIPGTEAQLGAMAQSNVDQGPDATPIESDLKTAAHLGKRVAEIARGFKN